MTANRTSALLATSATIAAALLLAACGGSHSPADAAAAEQANERQAETKFADFAKCLREHGVNAEAISHPGGGHGLKVSPGRGSTPAAFEAAQTACARYRPAPKKVNLSPQQKVEMEEAVQKFAKCMREHGIHVEVSTQGGDVQIGIHRAGESGGGPNPESPGFQRAQTACQKLLPRPPGAGPATRSPGPGAVKGGEGGVVAGG